MAGILKTLNSTYWKQVVFPPFKKKYPIDAAKIESELQGVQKKLPRSNFALGIVLEIREALKSGGSNLPLDWGLWSRPTVMLHNARGGVEYQEEQVKYFGSALLDLNSPNSWDNYIARAIQVGLPVRLWHHCHTNEDISNLCIKAKMAGQKECGVNLEDLSSGNVTPQGAADIIDDILGKDSICVIPNLGWIQNRDWSPLSRHVFLLECFLNDPWKDWEKLTGDQIIKQCADHARACGAKKVSILCGIYDASAYNPLARKVTAAEYLAILGRTGERFGGIYLGDNNGPDYSVWA
jgi:hypothetical protein